MLQSLRDALGALSESVLPAGTPSVAAVPHALRTADAEGSRERLKGSIVRCTDGSFFLVPADEVPDSCTAASKGCYVSSTGDPADAVYRTATQMNAIATGIGLGLLTTGASSGASAGSLSAAGLGVVVSPVVAAAFSDVSVSVGGGAPSVMGIDNMMLAIGRSWTPWAGADATPPPIPAVVGVPIDAAANATPVANVGFLGDTLHSAMRSASLNTVGIQVHNCGEAATLLVGLVGGAADADLRPISSGLAASANPAAPTDSPALSAIRASASATIAALGPLVDSLDMRAHASVAKGVTTLQSLALPVGLRQRAGLVHEALRLAALAAPQTPPLPHGAPALPTTPPAGTPPPAVAGVAGLVALAMGRSAPDPTREEAARRLALVPQSAALPPADREAAILAISAELAASGFAPRGLPPPALPAGGATAPAAFAGLRIAGSEGLTSAEVLAALATAFSRPAGDLAALLCRSARRPPPRRVLRVGPALPRHGRLRRPPRVHWEQRLPVASRHVGRRGEPPAHHRLRGGLRPLPGARLLCRRRAGRRSGGQHDEGDRPLREVEGDCRLEDHRRAHPPVVRRLRQPPPRLRAHRCARHRRRAGGAALGDRGGGAAAPQPHHVRRPGSRLHIQRRHHARQRRTER